jgi:hypothetical protein
VLPSTLTAATRAEARLHLLQVPEDRMSRFPLTVDERAVHVCRTIRDVRGETEAFVALDRLVGRAGLERRSEVDAAAAYAAARGWLAFGDAAADFALLLERAP